MSRPESIADHGNPPRRVGLEGYVISDWILGLRNAATSLTAGLDVEMPYRMIRAQHLADALRRGEAAWADVDRGPKGDQTR